MRVEVDDGLSLVLCQLTGFGAKFLGAVNPGGGDSRLGIGQSLTRPNPSLTVMAATGNLQRV